MILRIFLAALCAGVMTFRARAETFDVKAKAGTETRIGDFVAVSRDDCTAQPIPRARVTKKARHGRIDIRLIQGRLAEGFCKGAVVRGVQFVYAAARGYRGPDEATIDIPWEPYVDAPSASVRTYTYRIAVE